MWLLHTSTAELRWFNPDERVRYAILSHVWDKNEQTFEQVRALQHSGGLAQASDKITNFCEFARKRGYQWVWLDISCIDKTSSAELSEAINSMFQWYESASECVAFLADVPETEDPSSIDSAFRRSRWFTRGWTLQELIAPREVLFVGAHWHILGSKHSMNVLLDEITGIDAEVLTHATSVDLVSVAERISWASKRNTTRIEDEAYSLMGLFGVHMPTVYGEGRNAFLRLQEEILRTIPDESIFVWGPMLRRWNRRSRRAISGTPWGDSCEQLLAVSPRQFAGCKGIVSLSAERFQYILRWLRMGPTADYFRSHFTTTSHGIRAYVPTGSFDDSPIAVLACATGAEDEDNVIGLVLRASGDRYRVGHDDGELGRWRTFEIPVTSYAFIAKRIMLKRTMTDVTIIHRASPHLTGGMPRPLLASWPRCEIALAPWTFYAILDQGFRLYLLTTMDHGPLQGAVESALPESAFIPVSEPPRFKLSQLTGSFAVLRLTHPTLTYAIDILLKPCSAPFHPPGGDSETIHLYAIYTWPPKTGSEPLPESSPQLRSPATSSLAASGLVSRRASEPCPGAQETGRCPLRTFTGSKKLADPKVSTWAIHTRSERIASGDIITYILGIRMRQMTEAELAEVRTPPSSDGAGASPAPSHIKPPVDEDKSRAGESNQVGSTDGAQPPAGKEDDKKPEDGSSPIQRRGMLGRISRLLKR